MADIYKAVGRRIQSLRRKRGLTQEGLAEIAGLHRSHLGEIERGETNITLATLQTVGGALGVPVWAILKHAGVSAKRQNG
jgi:transcriptional regulator with XRE-family HTH domain